MAQEDGIDDFEAGYLGTEAPAAKPTPEEPKEPAAVTAEDANATQAAATAEPEPKPEPEPEPEWKKEIAALRAENEKLAQRTRNVEGHIGGLTSVQKTLQETMTAAQAAAKKVNEAPTQQQMAAAIDDPADWKAIEADYPEWARATKALIDARQKSAPQVDIDSIQKKFAEQVKGQTEAVRKEAFEAALEAVIPDWTEEVKTDLFKEWREKQPQEVQDQIAWSHDFKTVAKILRRFSDHKAKTAAEAAAAAAAGTTPTPKPQTTGRQERFAAAVAPKGTAGTTPSKSDEDEFEAGYAGR